MRFSEVIGQRQVKEKLLFSYKTNKVSHAQMFIAPEGAGGLPLALAFAQYINCSNKQEDDSCGTCPSCSKMQRMIHPDVHYTFPVVPKKSGDKPISAQCLPEWRKAVIENPYIDFNSWMKEISAENRQGNIPISECHDIIKKFSLKSYEGGYKMLILWLPEFLGKEGNSLLKLIEEPPQNSIFLLVAKDVDKILNTIISRTQLIRVPPLQSEDIAAALTKDYEVGEAEALQAAHLSGGDFNAAIQVVKSGKTDYTSLMRNWLRLCYARDWGSVLQWVESMAGSGRENQKNFLVYSSGLIRECLLRGLGVDALQKLNPEEEDFVKGFSRFVTTGNAGEIAELIDKAHYNIERNANSKIIFFNLSLRLHQVLFANAAVAAKA